MLVIRLSRGGGKKRPYSHIVVAEKSRPRDGRFIERIGFCNPLATVRLRPIALTVSALIIGWAKALKPSDAVLCLARNARRVLAATVTSQ